MSAPIFSKVSKAFNKAFFRPDRGVYVDTESSEHASVHANMLAPFYDAFNGDIDYSSWADFIEEIIGREYKIGKPELVLDLGCGTGSMTLELASRGYDMTGVDYSVEMLDVARANRAFWTNSFNSSKSSSVSPGKPTIKVVRR